MKKRKILVGSFISAGGQEATHNGLYGKIPGKRPPARDGHTGVLHGD